MLADKFWGKLCCGTLTNSARSVMSIWPIDYCNISRPLEFMSTVRTQARHSMAAASRGGSVHWWLSSSSSNQVENVSQTRHEFDLSIRSIALSLSLHYACKHNQSHAICVQCNQEAESSRIWRCRCHHWGESRREMFETQSTLQCSNFTALLCFFRHKHSLLGSVKSKSSTSSEALLGCKSKRFLKMVGWYLKILVKMTVGKTMSCLPSPSHHHVDRWYV